MQTANLAIVFTELVGFALRTGRQTYEQNQRMLRVHEALLLPVFRAFAGRRVKTIGGTFLVVFESPTSAVQACSALQDRLWEWNQTAQEPDRLEVRCGVNLGEVRLEKGDVFGEPVNIAARVVAQAAPGEVLLTEVVRLSMRRSELRLEDLGARELKGVPEEILLHRLEKLELAGVPPFGRSALVKAGKLPDPEKIIPRAEVGTHLRAAADAVAAWASERWSRVLRPRVLRSQGE
jgi:adenylate cyclase